MSDHRKSNNRSSFKFVENINTKFYKSTLTIMSEFNYFSNDFCGLEQLYPYLEYPEEFYLLPFGNNFYNGNENWDCSNIANNNMVLNETYQKNLSVNNGENIPASSYSWQTNSMDTVTSPASSVPMSSPNQLYDFDKKTNTVCNDSMSNFMDLDLDLDKYNNIELNSSYSNENDDIATLLFDYNYIESSLNTLDLPDKTYICNDSCNMFLKESSENLNSQLQIIRPNEQNPYQDSAPVIPTTIDDTFSNSTTFMNTPSMPKPEPTLKAQNISGDDEKTFVCTYGDCRKVYAKAGHLKAHLRRHIGDKPYICNWPNCTWRFSRSDELSRHRRSHSGIKPYKCDYCPKCFSRSDHLTKHRKVHERKLAAMKIKAVWTSLPVGRPGRRPKNSENRNLTVEQ